MTCIGVGADIWPCRVVGGQRSGASRIWMAAESIAQVLHVGRVGDLARRQRSARCSAGPAPLRPRQACPAPSPGLPTRGREYRRHAASGKSNVPPPRGPAANSGSRPIPPPHAGIESSACGAPVVTHRVPTGHAYLMAHDGAGAVSARNRLGSPSVSSRTDEPRSHARMSYSLAHCQTALEQRLACLPPCA